MIVIGSDPHKRSYTFSALVAATGELLDSETVKATSAGHERMLGWARRVDDHRVWAVEDCRHVSAKLERFLLARGERVVRVPPMLMAGRRRSIRERGKSDPIDSLAVARAALEEGIDTLPTGQLDGPAREIKLLLDHRHHLVAERTGIQNRLRGCSTIAGPSSNYRPAASTGSSGSTASRAASPAQNRRPTSGSCATRSAPCAS